MTQFLLKIFFPTVYEKNRRYDEVKDFVVRNFYEYRPNVCGEGFSSTMLSEDPMEILKHVASGRKQRLEPEYTVCMYNGIITSYRT
jgi:hypothetical protein